MTLRTIASALVLLATLGSCTRRHVTAKDPAVAEPLRDVLLTHRCAEMEAVAEAECAFEAGALTGRTAAQLRARGVVVSSPPYETLPAALQEALARGHHDAAIMVSSSGYHMQGQRRLFTFDVSVIRKADLRRVWRFQPHAFRSIDGAADDIVSALTQDGLVPVSTGRTGRR